MPISEQDYCDLVMKGGITSGIVYPNAVIALARKYRFKNIGGTSAGAIAAAATASAALGQRRKDLDPACPSAANVGFEGLSAVAKKLKGEGFIYSLFQPVQGAHIVYRLLIVLTEKPGPLASFGCVIAASLALGWGTTVVSMIQRDRKP